MTTGELVPFGKYKGQPVETLIADAGYRDWLMGQSWFRERFAVVYQTIVNYAGEPADTPEHNQLQASFLDDGRCLALARLLFPPAIFDGAAAQRMTRHDRERIETLIEYVASRLVEPRIDWREFEVGGWDVVYGIEPAELFLQLTALPPCLCECDHERDCPGSASCRGGDEKYGCRHQSCDGRTAATFEWWQNASPEEISHSRLGRFRGYEHCDKRCVWRNNDAARWLLSDSERIYAPAALTARVECKPDLGDDFPSVLRQVTRYDADPTDRRCVVVRRHQFQHVTWEQVTEMFRASGITLIDEALLTTADDDVWQEGART